MTSLPPVLISPKAAARDPALMARLKHDPAFRTAYRAEGIAMIAKGNHAEGVARLEDIFTAMIHWRGMQFDEDTIGAWRFVTRHRHGWRLPEVAERGGALIVAEVAGECVQAGRPLPQFVSDYLRAINSA